MNGDIETIIKYQCHEKLNHYMTHTPQNEILETFKKSEMLTKQFLYRNGL